MQPGAPAHLLLLQYFDLRRCADRRRRVALVGEVTFTVVSAAGLPPGLVTCSVDLARLLGIDLVRRRMKTCSSTPSVSAIRRDVKSLA
jgi:hypothetical protein